MNPFSYERASDVGAALQAVAEAPTTFLAGGTELLNWMRLGLTAPVRLLDISRLPGLADVEAHDGLLRIGALGKLNDVASHPSVVSDYPVLSEAIFKAASAQLRNLATIGGNLLQKTRCAYFRAEEPLPCNKREPHCGCSALHGFHERHAIFGWSEDCVATHPSDPAVALMALDATVVTRATKGERRIPIADFFLPPGQTPWRENVLEPGELITAIELTRRAPHSAYVKARERESYEYAIVSAAAVLDIEGNIIRQARLALGSVAYKPWRLAQSEVQLKGVALGSDAIAQAVDAGMAQARPLARNGYKITLARNAMLRAISQAAQS
jgi:xanthine dehydrogenase YagS FAD-binding subunit